MSGPLWVRWTFAALFGILALHCARRLVPTAGPHVVWGAPCRAPDRAADVSHMTMSAGMVVMFLPVATPLAPSWWAVLFGGQSVWWVFRAIGSRGLDTGRGSHLVASVVMAGMFAALPAAGLSGTAEHAGHLSASSPLLAIAGWVATAYFLGQALVCGLRVATPHPGAPAPRTPVAGADTVPVRLLMGLGMSYMLLTML
jgi:hypothetical protein